MMLTALCEGTPERMAALARQESPFVLAPPQAPFKFAVSCCGFQGATKYYNGFYNPKISTPSLHVVAEFDTIVSAERSTKLADACEDASIVHFRGTHHVPTDKASLYEMARFIANACSDKSMPSPVGVAYSIPAEGLAVNELFKRATITHPKLHGDGKFVRARNRLSYPRQARVCLAFHLIRPLVALACESLPDGLQLFA